MKLTQLMVNHVENPRGFCIYPISFSWKVEDAKAAKRQKWIQLTVWCEGECIFDSGRDEEADSLDYSPRITLLPRTEYLWEVTVCADNGETAKAASWFETGKMEEVWSAKWITTQERNHDTVIFAKSFKLNKEIKRARIYACGLGVYELYTNGCKAGDEYLAPGYHSYDFHLQTQTYDVTETLIGGENKIEIWLGDGWFKGRLGFDGGFVNIYGDRHYAVVEMHVEYTDGSREIIKTDDSWCAKKSPVVFSNIYDGEIYDANIDANETADVVIEQQPSGCGGLSDRYSLPIVKKEKFLPVEILHTPKGETVLDFGQNLTGWVEFDCELSKGERITLTASEIMQDECFYHENLRTAKTEFVYISDGQKTLVRPHFTFYGFRYMKLECEEIKKISNLMAYHLRSNFDQIGEIRTGNDKVNQLFSNALWSQKDNFLDVPTDCPQRDERLGWTGDAQVFSETACYNMHVPAFFRKYLWDMRSEQSILGGSVPNIVPRLKQGMISEHGACPWADAGVIIPWNVYCHYGSKTLLAETYPGMKAWVECQREKTKKAADTCLLRGGFHFADWLALDNEEQGPFGKTDPLYIANAYYYLCARIVMQAAEVLGEKKDVAEYETLSLELKQEIQKTYFDENEICIYETQTASALALAFDLMPEQKIREGENLLKRVQENGNHLNTGFVGTPLLCPALTEAGHHQTAVDLLLNEDYPGWLYSVNLGATTIWERWNSVLEDGHISSEGMNSLNHYSYGSIAAWMYKDVCGICPEKAGFVKAKIIPHPDRRLKFAEGILDAAVGRYCSRWEYRKNGSVVYEVEVPFNAEAVICLPKGKYQVEGNIVSGEEPIMVPAGTYRFEEQEESGC